MSAIYLFFTANISANERASHRSWRILTRKVINDAISAAGGPETHSDEFSLIRSPDQRNFDRFTTAPVAPFVTGFSGWSVAELGNFVQGLDCDEDRRPDTIIPRILLFAVLDTRSEEDNTIKLVQKYEEVMEDAVETLDWSGPSVSLAWVSLRIRFSDFAGNIGFAIAKSNFFSSRAAQRAYGGKDGIWKFDDSGHQRWAQIAAYDSEKPFPEAGIGRPSLARWSLSRARRYREAGGVRGVGR